MTSRCIEPHPDCPECKGSGTCQSCKGSGEVEVEVPPKPNALERWYDMVECPDCHNGDGECQRCDATAAEIEKYGAHDG